MWPLDGGVAPFPKQLCPGSQGCAVQECWLVIYALLWALSPVMLGEVVWNLPPVLPEVVSAVTAEGQLSWAKLIGQDYHG